MKLRRVYNSDKVAAYRRPWWCGIAYWEPDALTAIGYPLGIHLIVRAWRRWHPTPEQRAIIKWRRAPPESLRDDLPD